MDKKKVLIVDDDKDLLLGLHVRLKASGYWVVTATDGVMAIAVARKEEPDLAILDIGLPGGDGFIVMQRLARLLPMIPIIILSARDPLVNEPRAREAGAEAFLQKPVDNNELLAVVRKALGETVDAQAKV